jgi:hypothetical protein
MLNGVSFVFFFFFFLLFHLCQVRVIHDTPSHIAFCPDLGSTLCASLRERRGPKPSRFSGWSWDARFLVVCETATLQSEPRSPVPPFEDGR